MKQVSVEQAFGWAQAVAVREWRLVLPVALAFFGLPGLLVDVFSPEAFGALLPTAPPDPAAQARALLILAGLSVFNLAGALAVTALALVPGISVGEAIGRAGRRLPRLAGALLLVAAGVLAVALLVALALAAMRATPVVIQSVLLVALITGGIALWARLVLLTPVLVERALGPAQALQRTWGLTSGAFWPLVGAMLAYLVGGMVVLVAFGYAAGVTLALLGRALGAAPVGVLLAAVVFRALASAVSAGFQLLVVALYRQL